MHEFLCGVNEGVTINGGDWQITVLDIQADHVRLALYSDSETPSYREETIYFESPEIDSEAELLEFSFR